MKKAILGSILLVSMLAAAQQPAPMPPMAPRGGDVHPALAPAAPDHAPGMPRFPGGKWWKNSELVRGVGISDAQVQQMEQVFQENRLRLIDLRAALEKEETILEPLVDADSPNETQVLAQIDKVSQARAALERGHAQLMLSIRKVLTVEQWKKLKEMQHHGPMMRRREGPGGPDGPPRMPAPGSTPRRRPATPQGGDDVL